MKVLILSMAILALTFSSVFGAEPLTLTDQNVQKFINVFPEYQQLVKKYGETLTPQNSISAATQFGTEMKTLLNRYGLSMKEFPLIAQKVTMGLAVVRMKQNGMAGMMTNIPQFKTITEQDKTVIEKYFPQLQSIMGMK